MFMLVDRDNEDAMDHGGLSDKFNWQIRIKYLPRYGLIRFKAKRATHSYFH